MIKKRKINIITLGCSKNVVDSEKLLRQIRTGGHNIVHDTDDPTAEIVIINTCGFINDAREESIDTILQYAAEKKAGNIEKLYVIGCLSERYMKALKEEIPEVDGYYGVNNSIEILKELDLNFRSEYSLKRIITGPRHYAYLKISEGCNRICSFCAIPQIRGKYVSRPVEELVEEAKNLAAEGVRELILIAQDLNYYGLDLYNQQKLTRLVEELLRIESVEWIRLHYLYPAAFPFGLIDLMKENKRICRYIDIPIQHITDRMLGLMRRSHNRDETEALLHALRSEIPDAAIRTTLIAGHPGETEDDFNELKNFITEFRFNRLGVFGYSHEEGTFSHNNYSDEIPDKIKVSRVSELMEIQQTISNELNQTMTGKTLKVIIDRREDEFLAGRTEYDSPEVDQEVLIPACYDLKPGDFYDIHITGSDDFDVFGVPA